MLDKSIPYKNIIMRGPMERVSGGEAPILADGYSYRAYEPGDMRKWAEIEFSVGEFPSVEKAVGYFTENYLPFENQMKKRCWFILDAHEEYVATATAWYFDQRFLHWPALNWVAVKPRHQDRGLGKGIVKKALSLFPRCEKGPDVWLHTQTWSHKAIGIYLHFGFYGVKHERMAHYKNDFPEAVIVLKDVMPPETYRLFMDTAR